MQSGGPASVGSPAGRAALSGAAVGVTRKEVKSEPARRGPQAAVRRGAGRGAPAGTRAFLSTARRERGTVGPRGAQVASSGQITGLLPSSVRISFLIMSVDFYYYHTRAQALKIYKDRLRGNKCNFVLLLDHSKAQEAFEGGAQEGSEEGSGVRQGVKLGPQAGDA